MSVVMGCFIQAQFCYVDSAAIGASTASLVMNAARRIYALAQTIDSRCAACWCINMTMSNEERHVAVFVQQCWNVPGEQLGQACVFAFV